MIATNQFLHSQKISIKRRSNNLIRKKLKGLTYGIKINVKPDRSRYGSQIRTNRYKRKIPKSSTKMPNCFETPL